jgi:hypothetical protein
VVVFVFVTTCPDADELPPLMNGTDPNIKSVSNSDAMYFIT